MKLFNNITLLINSASGYTNLLAICEGFGVNVAGFSHVMSEFE